MVNSIPEHIAGRTATNNIFQKQIKLAQAFGKCGQTFWWHTEEQNSLT